MLNNKERAEKAKQDGAKKYKDILKDITKIRTEEDRLAVSKTLYASAHWETITTEQETLCYGILNAMFCYKEGLK